jgi:hypothetical protein
MTIDEMIDRMLTGKLMIIFMPGKFGRVDLFTLHERNGQGEAIATAETQPGEETLAFLMKLDEQVRITPQLSCVPASMGIGMVWQVIGNTIDMHLHKIDNCAELYRDRLDQQQRVLEGKIKRGRKAFGFFPLDGGR